MRNPLQSSVSRFFAILGISVLLTTCANAQYGDSPTNWQRLGLEPLWSMQVSSNTYRQTPAKLSFYVSHATKARAFEVVHGENRDLFVPGQLDRYGLPTTEDDAYHLADVRSRVLATRGIQSKVETRETPTVTIYSLSNRGILRAIDGESGVVRWSFPTGNPNFQSLTPTANEDYVAVVNGSTLYVVALVDGKLVFERQLTTAPGAAPAMTEEHVFVPLINGIVEAYRLKEDERRRPPIRFASFGSTNVKPTVSPGSISWPTDRGFLYVADAEEGRVRFRMEARSDLVSHSTYLAPNRLMVASVDGYLFCVDEHNGRLLWEFSAGESLTSAPVAISEQAFVVSENSQLFAVDAAKGTQLWSTSGVHHIVSVGQDRLYGVSRDGHLLAVDRASGGILDRLVVGEKGQFVTNFVSDRLYFLTAAGQLKCLRQQTSTWPTIHVTDPMLLVKDKESKADRDSTANSDSTDSLDEAGDDSLFEDEMAGDDSEDDLFGDGMADDAAADDGDLFGGDDGGDDLFDDGADDGDLFGEDDGF